MRVWTLPPSTPPLHSNCYRSRDSPYDRSADTTHDTARATDCEYDKYQRVACERKMYIQRRRVDTEPRVLSWFELQSSLAHARPHANRQSLARRYQTSNRRRLLAAAQRTH